MGTFSSERSERSLSALSWLFGPGTSLSPDFYMYTSDSEGLESLNDVEHGEHGCHIK